MQTLHHGLRKGWLSLDSLRVERFVAGKAELPALLPTRPGSTPPRLLLPGQLHLPRSSERMAAIE